MENDLDKKIQGGNHVGVSIWVYTMEIALQRRGVDIRWVNPNSVTDVAEMGTGIRNGVAGEKFLLGYIVGAPASWWMANIYLRFSPLETRIFTSERHWFDITWLERVSLISVTAYYYQGEGNKKEVQWTVIDSEKSYFRHLSSKGELIEYLCGLWDNGSQIFQATLEFKTAEKERSE